MRKIFFILLAVLVAGGAEQLRADDVWRELETVVVQEGGRKKPFLTFAQEELTLIHGRANWRNPETGERWPAVRFVTEVWANPDPWLAVPVLLVDYRPLKELCGLDVMRRHFSLRELVDARRLWEIAEEANEIKRRDRNAKVTTVQQKALDVAKKVEVMNGLVSGEFVRVVANPEGPSASWGTLLDLLSWYGDAGAEVFRAGKEFLLAVAAGDARAEQAVALREGLRGLKGEYFPERAAVNVEVAYLHWHPFRLAWIALLLGLVGMAAAALFAKGWGHGVGVEASFVGIGLLLWGMGARVFISGRAPVTNMYETVVWLALGILIFALAFEWKNRCRYYFWSSFPVAIVALMLADASPTVVSPALDPLVAVLRSNFWLTVHVMTIVTSYSAFAVAMGVAHIVLWNHARGVANAASQRLSKYVINAMHLGVWLLGTGIVLGAVWANYSWGRFWDWDPKETFSLVAFLGYLVTLHGRIFGFWKGVGVAVGAILSFQLVLVAWYGVNFILAAGLHSYGFGSGNHTWFYALMCGEVLFVAVTLFLGARRARVEKVLPEGVAKVEAVKL